MTSKARVRVLLSDLTSGERVGIIDFDPAGMLVFSIVKKDLHYFALKSVEHVLTKQTLAQPLYIKYAELLKRRSSLPVRVLEREANSCANVLNKIKPPLKIGRYTITATVVR